MHILHTEASCGWGGQEIRILEESRGLIKRGHEVKILCPPESRIYSEGTNWGVPTIDLPIGKKNLKGMLALRRWLIRHPVDVINTHSSTDSWLANLACRTIYTPPPIVRTRHISSPIPANAASRWLYAKAVRHVVTTGEALREQVINQTGAAPDKVTSVPTGIDPTRFQPADKVEARRALGIDPALQYIGIAATLRSWKGHRFLLDAFANLDIPGWRLLIIGSGPQADNIAAQIRTLNISNHVILAGQRNDVELWMQAMDIFCLPSYANEGVPQAILQAMLTGLPIITTPVGAILEAVTDGDTALVVQPQSADAIAGALKKLMLDPDLRLALGQHARQIALSRFSLDIMLNRMEQVFFQATQAPKT